MYRLLESKEEGQLSNGLGPRPLELFHSDSYVGYPATHFFLQESDFALLMTNDEELERRANADWLLVAERTADSLSSSTSASSAEGLHTQATATTSLIHGSSSATPSSSSTDSSSSASTSSTQPSEPSQSHSPGTSLFKGIYLNLPSSSSSSGSGEEEAGSSVLIGSTHECSLVVEGEGVAPCHARLINHGTSRYGKLISESCVHEFMLFDQQI